AINESIELAKTFGGDSSGKFVNGVLGTVYREIGGEKNEKMPEEKLGGAVIHRKNGKDILFAMVHDVFGYWTLSKGHIKDGESLKDGVAREVKEEIGIDVKIEDELGANEYVASDPEKGKIKKSVAYFIASTSDEELKLKETGGLDGVKWFKLGELPDLRMYDDIKPIVAKAIKAITGRQALN
ncbi:MAG: NUDIX domain-containing protein, partial [bacterium]|nr:NUDIX domain-containing protein [bacterium]